MKKNNEFFESVPLMEDSKETQITIPFSRRTTKLTKTDSKNGEKDFSNWIPTINILETDKAFRIELCVPGVTKENCKIGIDKNVLWVSGTRTVDREKDNLPVNLTRKEFNYGSFYRSFL